MNCFHCKKEIQGSGTLLDADGDFVCDEACRVAYCKQRDKDMDFLATATDGEFYEWMGVPELIPPERPKPYRVGWNK